MKTIKFNCRFCGIETGSLEVVDSVQESDVTNTIADTRCSACEALFGKFTPMSEKYMQETGKTYDDFINAGETHEFKAIKVDQEIAREKSLKEDEEK